MNIKPIRQNARKTTWKTKKIINNLKHIKSLKFLFDCNKPGHWLFISFVFPFYIILLFLPLYSFAGTSSPLFKNSRTFYDDTLIARAKEKIAKYQWAKDEVTRIISSAEWLRGMSYEELWELVPPPEQIRAINVSSGVGCPVHGTEIFNKGGHYPWILSREKPFKVQCPVGGEIYPENDFVPWNTVGREGAPETGEQIIDKGLGWVDKVGNRYTFVAYYIFWQRWMKDVLESVGDLSQAFIVTEDPVYARQAAVMMASLASKYERLDYRTQGYHEGSWNVKGRISDYIWTTSNDIAIALAYDAIYPIFEQDEELIAFLKYKGIENPRNYIELKMLNVMVHDVYTGYVKGNMGAHQLTMINLAIVLDNDDPQRGYTTTEMRDWLMKGNGGIEDLLWNGFWRDGLGAESAPHYSFAWNERFYTLADLLPKLDVRIWDNPKLKKMADIAIDMTVAGNFLPSIGDSGGVLGMDNSWAWVPSLLGKAFRRYGDIKYAKAISIKQLTSRKLWEDDFKEEEVAAVVAGNDPELSWKTRNIGGYGLAILESGQGVDNRRSAWMYYGDASGGHGHNDRLTIGFNAHGYPMLPEMGYPTPAGTPKRFLWTSNTISHYGVVINEKPQTTLYGGHLNSLAASPGVQLMDASAEIAYSQLATQYRRTTALIDITDQTSYLLDIFRVHGGTQHDWSFHGPANFTDFTVAGDNQTPLREKGTLAGEDIVYASEIPPSRSNNYGWELQLSAAGGLLMGEDYGPLSLEGWVWPGNLLLTRKTGSQIVYETDEIPAGQVKVFISIYDYNQGNNTVDITIGGVTKRFWVEPSGNVGYRWVSQVYELPEPTRQVLLTSGQVGQSYIQIDRVIIAKDLRFEEPLGFDLQKSGFQYLFNIRRMTPKASWSATWRNPNNNLGLTLTVPEGSTREVITADAVPELQPGNPEIMQYIVGRNVVPEEQGQHNGELFSKYVAVIEPHLGAGTVTKVENLQGNNVNEQAIGLVVHRGTERDLVHSNLSHEELCQWQEPNSSAAPVKPFVVSGEFSLLTLDASGVKRAFLLNGTNLDYGGFSIHAAPQPMGKVVDLDFQGNTVTVDRVLSMPDAFRDAVAILGNELHQTSYTIKNAIATENGTTLEFGDVLFIIGMGQVAATDLTEHTVTSDRQLAAYGRIDGGRHAGRWLYNEDKSIGIRIARVQGNTFYLDGLSENLDKMFEDADGDGKRLYWISDIGPGDTFRIPTTTYVNRTEQGSFEVQSMTTVTIESIPPGDLNGDSLVGLEDAILCLKMLVGSPAAARLNINGDVNDDGKVGLAEATYIIMKMAGMR